jgi:hypothetical protein
MYYKKDDMMVSRKIADEMILVPIKHNVGDLAYMFTLNDVASRIWELIDGGKNLEEIVSVLTQEYEVEAHQAEADVLEFLAQMKDIGAIVEKAEGS